MYVLFASDNIENNKEKKKKPGEMADQSAKTKQSEKLQIKIIGVYLGVENLRNGKVYRCSHIRNTWNGAKIKTVCTL